MMIPNPDPGAARSSTGVSYMPVILAVDRLPFLMAIPDAELAAVPRTICLNGSAVVPRSHVPAPASTIDVQLELPITAELSTELVADSPITMRFAALELDT